MQSDSDRDRMVERLLRQSLKGRAGSVTRGPCLEAETLAAWADGALAGEELAAATAHASDCSRCQAMLAAIVRDDGAPAFPPLHEASAHRDSGVAGKQASGPAEAWWRSGWRLGWLVPLTAAAAALALWIAVPRNGDRQSIGHVPAQARAAARSSPKALEPQPNDSSALAGRKPASTLEGNLPVPSDERRDQARSNQAGSGPVRKEGARVDATQAREKLEKGVAPNRDRASSDTGRRAAADALGESIGDVSQKQRPTEAALAERQAQASPAAPPAAAPLRAGSANAVMSARESVTIAATSPAPPEILSPDRSSRWRPGAAGAVQYSSDGGATWQILTTGVSTDLTAGASPSASVCWLVGRAGTVLLSTDGRRWQRVTFPNAVDLTSVSATDARTATVTTADGRRLTTTDGGLTWRQL